MITKHIKATSELSLQR